MPLAVPPWKTPAMPPNLTWVAQPGRRTIPPGGRRLLSMAPLAKPPDETACLPARFTVVAVWRAAEMSTTLHPAAATRSWTWTCRSREVCTIPDATVHALAGLKRLPGAGRGRRRSRSFRWFHQKSARRRARSDPTRRRRTPAPATVHDGPRLSPGRTFSAQDGAGRCRTICSLRR